MERRRPRGFVVVERRQDVPGDGDIGGPLAAIAKAHPDVTIGSYPFQDDRGPNCNLVVRSRDPEKLAAAKAAVEDMVASVRAALRRTA